LEFGLEREGLDHILIFKGLIWLLTIRVLGNLRLAKLGYYFLNGNYLTAKLRLPKELFKFKNYWGSWFPPFLGRIFKLGELGGKDLGFGNFG